MKKTKLVKHTVCKSCLSVGITYGECICMYSNTYPTVEIEVEECACCGHILNDGNPPETEFNNKQLEHDNK